MRNILPQWDPNQKLSQQYPHIAITVLYAPMGWTEEYRVVLRKYNKLAPRRKHGAPVDRSAPFVRIR
jgi:hypothetical protein